jgi:uncharacterized protein YbjT (DUF2867 family)
MRPRILVTGATGTIGSLVTRGLCERGAHVVALVHTADKAASVTAESADVRVGDLRDDGQARAALDGIDKVFMVTPVTPDQVEIGDEIVAAASDADVDRIVKLSIIGAEDKHGSLFGRWHRHVEKSIERLGLRYTFLRPNFFMQNFLGSWGTTIPEQGRLVLPSGDAAVSYIDARDIADVAVETLLGDGHDDCIYTLTGPAAVTHAEVAAAIAAASGRPVEYVAAPEDAARVSLEQAGMPDPLVDGVLGLWAMQRAGGAALVTADVEDVIERRPRSIAEFARDHADAWRVRP